MSIPVRAYQFRNGMVMVFDETGQQVPEYQGYASEKLPLLRADHPDCEVHSAEWDGVKPDSPAWYPAFHVVDEGQTR